MNLCGSCWTDSQLNLKYFWDFCRIGFHLNLTSECRKDRMLNKNYKLSCKNCILLSPWVFNHWSSIVKFRAHLFLIHLSPWTGQYGMIRNFLTASNLLLLIINQMTWLPSLSQCGNQFGRPIKKPRIKPETNSATYLGLGNQFGIIL